MTVDREAQVKALADLIDAHYPESHGLADPRVLARAILAAQPDHSALIAEARELASKNRLSIPGVRDLGMFLDELVDALESQIAPPPAVEPFDFGATLDAGLREVAAERELLGPPPARKKHGLSIALAVAPPPALTTRDAVRKALANVLSVIAPLEDATEAVMRVVREVPGDGILDQTIFAALHDAGVSFESADVIPKVTAAVRALLTKGGE